MRSPHFPKEYAISMVQKWALDREKGFYGEFFPLAMSKQSMQAFASGRGSFFRLHSPTPLISP